MIDDEVPHSMLLLGDACGAADSYRIHEIADGIAANLAHLFDLDE